MDIGTWVSFAAAGGVGGLIYWGLRTCTLAQRITQSLRIR